MRHLTHFTVLMLISMFASAVPAAEIPFTLHTTGVIVPAPLVDGTPTGPDFVQDVYTGVRPPWAVDENRFPLGVLPAWQEGSTVLGNIMPTGLEPGPILKLFFDITGSVTSYDDAGVEEGRFDFAGSGVQAVDVNPDNVIFDEDAGIFRQLFGTYRLLGEPLATTEITNVEGTFLANPPVGQFDLYSSGWLNMQIIPDLPLADQMFPNRQPVNWVYTTAGVGQYVPEPSAFAGLLIGVGLLASPLRRRSRTLRKEATL